MKRLVRHESYKCKCGKRLDSAFGVNGPMDMEPKEGSVTICLGCCRLYIFDKDKKLRPVTQEDYETMLTQPDLVLAVAKAIEAILDAKKSRAQMN